MLSEQLPFTEVLNKALAGPVNSLLNAVGVHPADSHAPISNAFAMQLLVVLIMLALFVLVRTRLSVEKPGGLQHMFEGLHSFIDGQGKEIIGHHHEPYTPFVVALFSFVLMANLIGMVPGFESPTAHPFVPLGLAICAFLYYNAKGIQKQGPIKYAAHFAGPMPALAPLMIPIEIVSHLARVMSLTIRLFANIFAGDMVTLVFFSLVPLGVPVIFLGLHIGVSFLQAYIFALLTTVYLAGAVAEEH
ncbi:MAG TPA: F0F1 ATP synthase subunit A [Terriglobales bacterium]|nr:F0F1 ATP synthase subunit A [Terriglobales bacterium]